MLKDIEHVLVPNKTELAPLQGISSKALAKLATIEGHTGSMSNLLLDNFSIEELAHLGQTDKSSICGLDPDPDRFHEKAYNVLVLRYLSRVFDVAMQYRNLDARWSTLLFFMARLKAALPGYSINDAPFEQWLIQTLRHRLKHEKSNFGHYRSRRHLLEDLAGCDDLFLLVAEAAWESEMEKRKKLMRAWVKWLNLNHIRIIQSHYLDSPPKPLKTIAVEMGGTYSTARIRHYRTMELLRTLCKALRLDPS
jgi:hypothetical protein